MHILLFLFMAISGQAQILRPSEVISFKDYCVCQDGKPVSYGICRKFCEGKITNGAEILFAKMRIGRELPQSGHDSVKSWCNKINYQDQMNPKCVIEARDESGNKILMDVMSFPKRNFITADVSALGHNKIYIFRMVEISSGARSQAAQLIKPTNF